MGIYAKLSLTTLLKIRDMNQELLSDPEFQVDWPILEQDLARLNEIITARTPKTNKREDCVRCSYSASDVSHEVCVLLYGQDYDTDLLLEDTDYEY